jgi:hypothetical protein
MSDEVTFEKPEGLLTEQEERGKSLVLEAAGIAEGDQVKLVTFRVAAVTWESERQPASYEKMRAYMRLEPEALEIHVPVYDPASKVDGDGDVAMVMDAVKAVGRQLDMAVVTLANERKDRQIVADDASNGTRPKRAALKGGGNQQGEVL